MLDHASNQQGADERITWRQADALALPFTDASFDIVVCQFSVMFFPDRVAGYSEAARVLKSGGQFLFSIWDDIESNEFADVVTVAAASIITHDPPRFLARTPHGHADVDLIRKELISAGFSGITIETIEKVSTAPSARHVALAYCHGTPLRNEIESRGSNFLDQVTDRATDALKTRFGAGPVSGKIRALVVTASR